MVVVNVLSAVFGLVSLVLLGAELYLHFARKRGFYRYVDVVTNIQTMFLYQLLGAAALGVIYVCYDWVHSNFALMEQEITSPLSWIAGFILADFCHYWFHRSSHQNNFLWGIHQGHHTSEDFNLSTAIRKGIFQQWVDWPFFLPMALLGYPFLEMFLPLKALQFTYQFWLHNQFVGKLPYIERILVTPSAHRVHHGQNPQYIDKNHAGVFILWDKLFGTFAEEKEKVIYGTTVAVNSFNPIGIQFVWWKDLWLDALKTKSWRSRLAIPFKHTGWRPADVAGQPRDNEISDLSSFKPYNLAVNTKTKLYAAVQVVAMVIVVGMVSTESATSFNPFSDSIHGFALAYLLLACASMGFILNQKPRAKLLEFSRHALVIGFSGLAVAVDGGHPMFTAALGLALASAALFGVLQFVQQRGEREAQLLDTAEPPRV